MLLLRHLGLLAIIVASSVEISCRSTSNQLEFAIESKEGFHFDARIEVPNKSISRNVGVLLIGGGFAADIDWTTPGDFTISGKPTHDARKLSTALVESGYTVMRWSSIRRDDPEAAKGPDRFSYYPYPQTVEHARAALYAFRAQSFVPDDRIVVLGHSLGARRAIHLMETDPLIAGVILLSGADLSSRGMDATSLRVQAGIPLAQMDFSGDGQVTPWEFNPWKFNFSDHPLASLEFDEIDFDENVVLTRWEMAAQLVLHNRRIADEESPELDARGLGWCDLILADDDRPVLAIWGSVDDHAMQAVLLHHLANVELTIIPDLGHNLAREERGKTGPIDDTVIIFILNWLEMRF